MVLQPLDKHFISFLFSRLATAKQVYQ